MAPRAGGGVPTDVLVLAGGTGARLGGASKPDVVARGARLLDHVLEGLGSLRGSLPLGRVCVVAPEQVRLPAGVLRALEDPPLGGPVAGVAAGLAALGGAGGPVGAAPWTALLTCDAPESWRALPALHEALGRELEGGATGAGSPARGACVRSDHVQYLLGVYLTGALREVVAPGGAPLRDVAVRRVLSATAPVLVDLAGTGAERAPQDLDTWDEVRRWEGTAGTRS